MSEWISVKDKLPEYIRTSQGPYKGELTAPTVIIRFRGDKGWNKYSGRPRGVDIGKFTVHTKEWRRDGANYASRVTHWQPLPGARVGMRRP